MPLGHSAIARSKGLEPPTTRLRKPVLYPLSYERKVGADGFEPPCGIPDLQSGAFVQTQPHAQALRGYPGASLPAGTARSFGYEARAVVVGEGFEPPQARGVNAALFRAELTNREGERRGSNP
jgi:hypothetical protein